MTKLIFIEGVSGVGKSTITQKLCDKLRGMEYSVDRYREFDFPNPIDFYSTAHFKKNKYEALLAEYNWLTEDIKNNTVIADDVRLVRYYNQKTPLFPEPLLGKLREYEFCWNPANLIPLSEYTRVYKAVWEQFVQNTSNQLDYLIFDGSLIHHPINDMTRNYNATSEQITCHLNTLIETVGSFHPQIIYLSSDNVAERLKKARISRMETQPSDEQIRFWENRKDMDFAVMRQLSISCDVYDISQENWDSAIDVMIERILETDEEWQARIYPVILSEYNPAWQKWYTEEKAILTRLISAENIYRISHIGSTAVPGLMAKPTVDIILEINETTDLDELTAALSSPEYICLSGARLTMPTPPPHMAFIKGYLSNGFAEKVYHIHVRYPNDNDTQDKLLFRDYLITQPEAVTEYAELKRKLFKDYEHDRDGYTEAKGAFIKEIIGKARGII
jgi:GrpB-like predicted nucleotidyltransferase (UPF0157 family)/deoxyadenosine/deoxycytidine kinase